MTTQSQRIFVWMIIALASFSNSVIAHGGGDPITALKNNISQSKRIHQEFAHSESMQSKIEALQKLVRNLEARTHLLRDTMAREFPHVRENMSRYKVDYIEKTDEAIVDLMQTLEHLKLLMLDQNTVEQQSP